MTDATPTISMTGSIAPAACPGAVVIARWQLVNHSPLPVAANVYLRTAPAPLAGVACKGGRTHCPTASYASAQSPSPTATRPTRIS